MSVGGRIPLLFGVIFLGACGDEEADPPVANTWQLELEGLDPALLAVSTSGDRLIAVGGALNGAGTPVVVERNAGVWTERNVPTGWQGAIWWSWTSPDGEVWMVGDHAQIAHGSLDTLELVSLADTETTTHTTFYGVWGSSSSDVYMVGGSRTIANSRLGTLLHYDGTRLSRVRFSGTASVADTVSLFKVWGTASNDVMVVGGGGVALAWDGARWVRAQTGVSAQLTTVHGRSAYEKYAVGGLSQGLVLEYDGFSWREIGEPFAPPLSGVFAAPDGRLWVAGETGYLAVRDGGRWEVIDTGSFLSFHAVYADEGDAFAVGGILAISPEPRQGFLGRYGRPR